MTERYLLKEYTSFEIDKDNSQIDPDKEMVLKGIIQRSNALNQNGRIYPRDILRRELENYMKIVREKRAFGELDHIDSPIVNMKNISHMITEIWLEGDDVWGKIKVLDTPNGNIIKAVIKAGGVPGISSRALGSVQRENNANIVQDDLQLICFDIVSEPSTNQAFMHLAESKLVDSAIGNKIFNRSDRIYRAMNDIVRLKK